MLKDGKGKGNFTSLKVCRGAPDISHFLFADDILLFFKAEAQQAEEVRSIIMAYEGATGQLINPAECSKMFRKACTEIVQEELHAALQVQLSSFEEKYLGLPILEGRMSKAKCQKLQTHLTKSIIVWGDTLSLGGKETMIKAVAQAIPTYMMGVFKLPMFVYNDLNRMIRNFWWGSLEGKQKKH